VGRRRVGRHLLDELGGADGDRLPEPPSLRDEVGDPRIGLLELEGRLGVLRVVMRASQDEQDGDLGGVGDAHSP
jgi:hypothetical protein